VFAIADREAIFDYVEADRKKGVKHSPKF